MTPEYLVALSGLVVALIGALGGFVNSLTKKRSQFGDEDEKRLKEYDEWRPGARRWAVDIVDRLAKYEDPSTIPPYPTLGKPSPGKQGDAS